MTTRYRQLIAIVLAAGVTACGDQLVCEALPRPAIAADIRDSVTNAPAAWLASLILSDEGIYDSTFVSGSRWGFDSLGLTDVSSSSSGRLGVYDVRVRKAGYRLWERKDVRVGGDRCGANAVALQVRLQPQ